jgi:hypothetical protein
MKKLSVGLTVLALTTGPFTSEASASTAEACTNSYLAPLPGSYTSVALTAADPSGRYQVAQTLTSAGQTEVGIWRNGAGSILITPAEGYIEPLDVNARAEVVGYSYSSSSPWRAWRYQGGRRITLEPPAGYETSHAVAINAAGEVAGRADAGSRSNARAVAWTAGDVVRLLPLPDGFTAAEATDIDDDGVVVGFATEYDSGGMESKRQPVVWPVEGGYRLLPTSDADGQASVASVRNGIAVGEDNGHAVSWTLANDARTVLSTESSTATDVNAGGDIAVVMNPDLTGTTEFLRRNQSPRPAGDSTVRGLSDSASVYHEDRRVYDCG